MTTTVTVRPPSPLPAAEEEAVPSPALSASTWAATVLPGLLSPVRPEVAAAFGFGRGFIGEQGAVLLTDPRSPFGPSTLGARAAQLWAAEHNGPSVIERYPQPAAATPREEHPLWVRVRTSPGTETVDVSSWTIAGSWLGSERIGLDPQAEGRGTAPVTLTARLRRLCAFAEVLELAALPPFVEALLSPREQARAAELGLRRRQAFTAGRVALKLATLTAAVGDLADVDTLADDGVLARSPIEHGRGASIAHDRRLAVAVVSDRGLPGVDVELVAPRLEPAAGVYAGTAERHRADAAGVGRLGGLARIWTAKEACAKAWAVPLPTAWRVSELTAIGEHESAVRFRGELVRVFHLPAEQHLISLVEREC
ncbi:MAG: hypothetical protein JW751_04635 [Polyangiaceae bacterium]|nr:hypothetical protein [Polyangiaceae bacterium]